MFYQSRKELERIGEAGAARIAGTDFYRMCGKFWLKLEQDDTAFTPSAGRLGYWEAWVSVAIARAIHERRGDVQFLDVGANVGYYTMLAAAAGAPTMAFEPNPDLARMVVDSAAFNNLDRSVYVSEVAIGESKRNGTIYIPPGHTGGATLDHEGQCGPIVPVDTLDNLVFWQEGTGSFVVKVDVEGYERNAWDGAKRFREETDNIWFVEFVPERHGQDYNREWLDEVQLTHDIFLVNYEGGLDQIDTDLALKRDFDTLAFRSR